ncbi:MAG TPA: putative DNA binding domain-containing protein [Pyrinomonadaceae bacterium]|nr:putative DNA binding domain-containing protein [Chloracidobacterium sp.]MBP9934707.1 putative DNA binding domain-containing protein [Pyrinomonadaceae bacterium]MBK9439089.1 putative DNA binding domain-containing protein [Chloracidobacterium sp.]MBL0240507.1 putative DNA binding domain-containing protein [Chloracidobacterium sp.]HQX56638.1 putative DNA binding domain-containing protein [Pyrinomonadaceae bacterium]
MPRRKFRHTQRFDSPSDQSFQEYLLNQPAQTTTRTELLRLIRGGEDTYLELKVKLSNSEKIAQGIVALANTDGGTIIFGVNDQLRIEGVSNPEWVQAELTRICREEIVPSLVPLIDTLAFDSGKRIVALDIDGKRKPYRTRDGRFYMRFGAEKREVTRDELSNWLDELRPVGFENIPLQTVTEDDFDDGLLWSFASGFDDTAPNINLYQTSDFLRKDLLLAVGNADEFFPTVAAVLLFGKNDRVPELLPRSNVTVARFSGDNATAQLIEAVELKGNMHSQYEAIIEFIKRYTDLAKERPKRKLELVTESVVKARSHYHYYSVSEAVINALIHRDLALREIRTRINIYDNSIEFINPRRTNGFSPPASRAIRYGITQRLNPQIAAIFTRREYGINAPHGGLPMILRQSTRFSGRKPEIYLANDEFKLKILAA